MKHSARILLCFVLIAAFGCDHRGLPSEEEGKSSKTNAPAWVVKPWQELTEKDKQGALIAAKRKAEEWQRIPEPRWFNRQADIKDKDLVFKVLWYQAPYPRYYQQLYLHKDGSASTSRNVPNRGHQNSSWGKVPRKKLAEIKRQVEALNIGEQDVKPKPREGSTYWAFVGFKSGSYYRRDFVGSLPEDVKRIVDAVKSLVEAQTHAKYRKEVVKLLREKGLLKNERGENQPNNGIKTDQ